MMRVRLQIQPLNGKGTIEDGKTVLYGNVMCGMLQEKVRFSQANILVVLFLNKCTFLEISDFWNEVNLESSIASSSSDLRIVFNASGCKGALSLPQPIFPAVAEIGISTVEIESALEVAARITLCDLTICDGVEPKKLESLEMERSCESILL